MHTKKDSDIQRERERERETGRDRERQHTLTKREIQGPTTFYTQ